MAVQKMALSQSSYERWMNPAPLGPTDDSPSVRESAVCPSLTCHNFTMTLVDVLKQNPQRRRFQKTVKCRFLLSVRFTAQKYIVRKVNVDL
jgi:hypothetical protein